MSYSVTGADGRRIARNVSREEAYEAAARVAEETGEDVTVEETIVLEADADETIAPSAPKRSRRKS